MSLNGEIFINLSLVIAMNNNRKNVVLQVYDKVLSKNEKE